MGPTGCGMDSVFMPMGLAKGQLSAVLLQLEQQNMQAWCVPNGGFISG